MSSTSGWVVLAVLGGPILLIGVYVIVTFNRFVSVRAYARNAWSGIQVEMKRRYELIPNLVETVKGYAGHEKDLLAKVIELRNRAMANTGSPAAQSGDEIALMGGVRSVVALAEAYPDLKADAMFRDLHKELVNTEDRIAATRRFYNGNVREMNELIGQFPSSLIGGWFGFKPLEYFELEDRKEAEPLRVDLAQR